MRIREIFLLLGYSLNKTSFKSDEIPNTDIPELFETSIDVIFECMHNESARMNADSFVIPVFDKFRISKDAIEPIIEQNAFIDGILSPKLVDEINVA